MSTVPATRLAAHANAVTLSHVRLHSGDPGVAGSSNALGAGLSAATFDAASGDGERPLQTNVTVTGLTPGQSVTHISFWSDSGAVFEDSTPISSGATAADLAGEYVILAGTTIYRFRNPA